MRQRDHRSKDSTKGADLDPEKVLGKGRTRCEQTHLTESFKGTYREEACLLHDLLDWHAFELDSRLDLKVERSSEET